MTLRRPAGGGVVLGRRGAGSGPTASCHHDGRPELCPFLTTGSYAAAVLMLGLRGPG